MEDHVTLWRHLTLARRKPRISPVLTYTCICLLGVSLYPHPVKLVVALWDAYWIHLVLLSIGPKTTQPAEHNFKFVWGFVISNFMWTSPLPLCVAYWLGNIKKSNFVLFICHYSQLFYAFTWITCLLKHNDIIIWWSEVNLTDPLYILTNCTPGHTNLC